MTKILERENRFHLTQFGFRKERSTTEAISILQTAMSKSKKSKDPLYIAFIDLEKAYDRVDRKALCEPLNRLGF